jgi:hypothetical protein
MFSHICCNNMFQIFELFQSYVVVSVVLCCNYFIWMFHMFHTHIASVCPKCFICFKCMLHSSVSCCKCRPPALVSMRAGRAKPRPPTHGGGAGHTDSVGRRHRPRSAVAKEARASLSGGLKETDAAPVWKRQEQVIRAAWAQWI